MNIERRTPNAECLEKTGADWRLKAGACRLEAEINDRPVPVPAACARRGTTEAPKGD